MVINTSVDEPVGGKDLPTPTVNNDFVSNTSFEWSPSGQAVAGQTYTLTILTHNTSGYKFTKNTQPKIGANDAIVDRFADDYIIYHWDFVAKTGADSIIKRVDISVDVPVAGAKPDMNPKTPDDANYKFTNIKWVELDANKDEVGEMKPSDTFKANTTYTLYITVSPKSDSYVFEKANSLKSWFNGVTATSGGSAYSVGTTDMMVYKNFKTGELVEQTTAVPTITPTVKPTVTPTVEPTTVPTAQPTIAPTEQPTEKTWSKASNWAEEELQKASEGNLIPWIFEKQDLTVNITRREFAYVAVKLYEKITNIKLVEAKENPFKDTEDIEVLKAYNIGITQGTSADTFTPDALITREQMATMMTRALSKAGIDTKVELEKVSKFADDGEMHDWGKASIYYMSNIEIIKGVGNNTFNVLGNATREQALLISERSAEKFAK